jgi:hypothetical protein
MAGSWVYIYTQIVSFMYVNSVFHYEVSQKCAVLGNRSNTEKHSCQLLMFQQNVLLSYSGEGGMKRMKLTVTHVANS